MNVEKVLLNCSYLMQDGELCPLINNAEKEICTSIVSIGDMVDLDMHLLQSYQTLSQVIFASPYSKRKYRAHTIMKMLTLIKVKYKEIYCHIW